MSNPMLTGKRVLITHADQFMGPVLCDVFERHGAVVIRDTDPLRAPGAVEALVARAGQIDALVANLAITAPTTAVTDVTDDEWQDCFAALVHPLATLCRAVYDPRRDDADFRRSLSDDPAEQRAAFDLLRKPYPVRREIEGLAVRLRGEAPQLAQVVSALGAVLV